jgi:methylthioribose-1-phosphate isomerase
VKVNGKSFRTIWPTADNTAVEIIDQTRLPHVFTTLRLESMRDAERAIREMQVRGAPLIGVTAAYGVALSMKHHASDAALKATCDMLLKARPTAVNLRWSIEKMRTLLAPLPESERAAAAWKEAARIADEDVEICSSIGRHGSELISAMHEKIKSTVNILTHCNAGWLATVDWGTALAPVYKASDRVGIGPARCATHGDRGQHRRAFDAARQGGHGNRRHRPRHRARRCVQQDRHLPESAGRA